MTGSTSDSLAVRFRWVDELSDDLMARIRALFNASLELDDLIGFPGPLPDGPAAPYLDRLQLELAARQQRLLVACDDDGDIVAMTLLAPNPQPNCRHIAEVSKCVVHPKCRGRGIVKEGFRELLAYCRSSGIDVLTLDVRKKTRAESLWRALGFQPYGELPDYARVGGHTYAGVYLWARVEELERSATQ